MTNIFSEEASNALEEFYGEDGQFTPDEAKPSSSEFVNEPGFYHAYVTGHKVKATWSEVVPALIRLDFKILAGENKSQVDRLLFHDVRLLKLKDRDGNELEKPEPYSHDYASQNIKLAVALGIVPMDDLRLSKINWDNAMGQQCIIKVDADEDSYKDKKTGKERSITRYNVNWGNFWSVFDRTKDDSPNGVRECVMNGEALAMLTGGEGIDGSESTGGSLDDQLANL